MFFCLQEDIFTNSSLEKFKNETWNLTSIDGPFVGTCFTLSHLTEAKPFQFDFLFFMLKNQNLRMQIHNPGEEFWLHVDGFPTYTPTYSLPLRDYPNLKYVDVRLRDTITISKHTKDKPCLEESSPTSYLDCIKSKVISDLEENKSLNCTTWISDVLKIWPFPECKTLDATNYNSLVIQRAFFSNLESHRVSNCYLPCKQIAYSALLTFGEF